MRKDFKYLTAVYKVNNYDEFKDQYDKIFELAQRDDEENYVSAISLDNEMTRIELISNCFEKYTDREEILECISTILSFHDVSAWDWKKFEAGEYYE